MVIFDSILENHGVAGFPCTRCNALDLVDHAIFIFRPEANQLARTYELLRLCLARNQNLKCSILLSGRNAKELGGFLYERFADIVSRFLGTDLGFLGWMEGDEVQINPGLLFEEGNNVFQISLKTRLREILYPAF